ncbi:MAG: ACT domain-containing protein [Candidatus Methanohalarchaeum thermophilum]|uniref:ACT domain-containing protein n=1 Tax=Methanohalarchaeum thermophilum TaxID=1903181 RepID=A0A1Q6DTG9_METT1|nr:MAG: ACT domain-containing protein [Candidatus Methanohalarchaeum thermophilum]
MSAEAISIISENKPGVLRDITKLIADEGGNITFTQEFIIENGRHLGKANIYMEISGLSNFKRVIDEIESMEKVVSASSSPRFKDVYGKRVIIFGGGAQVSEVAKGAISEADRHNIRGEKISIDTIPLVGEESLSKAVKAVKRLHRAKILVLAGALLGGEITKAVKDIQSEGVPVISLENVGSVKKEADVVVSDPTLAGVLAVMAISNEGEFDVSKVRGKKI